MAQLTKREFTLFQTYIKNNSGIDLTEDKAYLIETRLFHILSRVGLSSFDELYDKLMAQKDPSLEEEIIDAITTNETKWFRDESPWVILEELFLPNWCNQLQSRKLQKIRIWSAAASTGQEAYSTAICIWEYLEKNNWLFLYPDFEVLGTDISTSALQNAKRGLYDENAISRGLKTEYVEKYFTKEGDFWAIDDKIKEIVQFKQFNLHGHYLFLGNFDLIFIRYAMIYFSSDLNQSIAQRLKDVLNPGGGLFLGSSEICPEIDAQFEKNTFKGSFFYKRRKGND